MRIPKRIEWRVGVVLVVVAGVLLGLCLALIFFRMDVGVEIAGVLSPAEEGMVLQVTLPESHLGLLAKCQSVRIDEATGPGWYADIRCAAASWTQNTGLVAQIVLYNEDMTCTAGSSPRNVTGMLLESRQTEILRVLIHSLYTPKDMPQNSG